MMPEKFVTARAGARRLRITRYKFAQIVEAGGVRIRELPGIPPTFCLSDLERIDAKSIRVAGQETGQAVAS